MAVSVPHSSLCVVIAIYISYTGIEGFGDFLPLPRAGCSRRQYGLLKGNQNMCQINASSPLPPLNNMSSHKLN